MSTINEHIFRCAPREMQVHQSVIMKWNTAVKGSGHSERKSKVKTLHYTLFIYEKKEIQKDKVALSRF